MRNRKRLFLVFIPLLVLFSWAGYHESSFRIGQEVELRVEGFDPRDLLSGHYITYTVDYPDFRATTCSECTHGGGKYLCLDTGVLSESMDANCQLVIRGDCRCWGESYFDAGIDRYYVPETHAAELDRLMREGRYEASIKVFVTRDGRAYVNDLLFEGVPWREFLQMDRSLFRAVEAQPEEEEIELEDEITENLEEDFDMSIIEQEAE